MRRSLAILPLLLLALAAPARADVEVPPLKQRVTDLTGTLDAGQQQVLEGRLAALESSKGAQLAVLMLPSTQPETIEQYGIRVVETWKLGRKGVDDGVLLLVAKDDHRVRIEVGYGLEGALNDATAKRIVSEVITPLFKRGDFYGGIDAGVSAISKVIAGEPLPPPAASSADQQHDNGGDLVGQLFGAGLVIFMVGNLLLRQLLGRLPSGLIVGGVIGMLAWVALSSLLLALIVGVVAFILSLAFGAPGTGGFPTGWSGGSGGGWSGGSSGDWSGGGGSFGGGGASGDW